MNPPFIHTPTRTHITAVPLPHVAHSFILYGPGCQGPITFLPAVYVCERRKRQCNNLRGISSLKDRVQLHGVEPSHIHKHTLIHTPPAVCLPPITAGPAGPVPSSPPPGPITTFLLLLFLAERDRGPLHSIITASTEQPRPSYFSAQPPPPLSRSPQTPLSILPISWPQAQVIYLGMLNKGKVQHKNRHRPDKQQSN